MNLINKGFLIGYIIIIMKDVNLFNYFLISILLLLGSISYIVYLYDFNLLISCLEQSLFILFFFFLTIFCLNEFKLSDNKLIKYFQIIIFILFILYIICSIIIIYFGYYNLFNDNILKVNSEDITIKGKIVLDKEAGAEVAKGISTLGSNIGLGTCVGTMAGGVAKTIAKSPLPPVQKAGLVIGAGVIGAIIHAGATAINTQLRAEHYVNQSSVSTNQNILPKGVNKFIGSIDDNTPLEILLQCICALNSICIWLIVVLFMQVLFKIYISDKPKLKLIDYILPYYSENIKIYIYKLIKLNKNMNIFYSVFAVILLLICLLGSIYFSWELYKNISSYVDVYIVYHKK